MYSPRNVGTVNDFHWEFKPVLSYNSKPHTFSTFLEKNKKKYAFTLSNQATLNLNRTMGK